MKTGLCIGLILLTFLSFLHLVQALPSPSFSETVPYAGFEEIGPAKNHILIIGDTQSTSHWEFWRERNDRERKLIADEIARRKPAFILHLGDLTTRGSSEKHWQEFDKLHKTWHEEEIPCFPLIGNHELYGNDKKALEHYFDRFPYLESSRWYSMIWKNVALVMLDSNFSTLTEVENERQVNWYRAELERFEKDKIIDHIIVCSHEPPFTNSRVVSPNQEVRTHFADPFVRYSKTRFFFSGHSHTYERFRVENKHFIVSGGGGGPRHKVTLDSQKRSFPDLFDGPELRFFHFCEIELHGKRLLFRVLRLESDRTFTVADSLETGEGS